MEDSNPNRGSGEPSPEAPLGSQLGARAMTVEYLMVLGLMALIVVARYWVTIRQIDQQADDAYLVNLSGRQRMLSQRILALSTRLALDLAPGERSEARRQLKSAVSSMEAAHYVLSNFQIGGPSPLASRIGAFYRGPPHLLDRRVGDYLREARDLAQPHAPRVRAGAAAYRRFAESSETLLASLDAAVEQYQKEGEKRVAGLVVLQKLLTSAILIILFLVGAFVFRPMVDRISREHAALEALNLSLEGRVAERSRQIEELRSRYYHGVNHELRTPITCLNAAFHALLEDFPCTLEPKQSQLLDISLRNTRRLTALIDDLLSATGAETGKLSLSPAPTGLAGLLAETVASFRLLAAPKEIRLEETVAEDLPPVLADPERLVQILTNLIGNAIKFTPPRGIIAIRAGRSADDPGFVLVSVSDTGRGIAAEDQAKLFERLYQVGPRSAGNAGLGLGLFISKQIVDLHGGRIWVESEPGRGSAFHFTLPIPPQDAKV